MPKLTKKHLDSLRSEPDRDVLAWDSELRGFGIRLKPTGAATFILQYRNAEGRSRRLSLGSVHILTPDQARDLAREKLVEVKRGNDPAEDRRNARAALTVGELCDWYLDKAETGELLGRRRRPIAKTTLALDRSRIDTHVRPLIGGRVVNGLSVADIEKLQAEITAGRTAKARTKRGGVTTGGAGVASRTITTLHAIFEQAVRLEMITRNPARGVRKAVTGVKRERRLALEEISALGAAIRVATDEPPAALAAIKLMLLTGFRRMEALALQRAWVDRYESCVRFPSTKTGPQVRIVGATAMVLLKAQKPAPKNPYVFPGETREGHFIGVVRVLDRLCKTADLEGVTPHVLRHTFASVAGDLGFSELTIAGLLGHAGGSVTRRYVHLDRALVLAADKVAEEIQCALNATPVRRRKAAAA
ncbi:MAG: site-specific integrase [Devosia sp.]|nr:site-specific integrase [Devosia sp.]